MSVGEPITAIVGTVIGAVAASVITLLVKTFIENIQEGKESEAKETAQNDLAEEALYTIDRYECTVEIDENGGGTFTRKYINVKAKQTFQNLTIPYRLLVGDGKILSVEVKEHLAGRALSKHDEIIDGGTVNGNVHVNGLFGPDDGPLSFEIVIAFEKGFFVTREETEEAYKKDDWKEEYVTGMASVPTKILVLSVVFPTGWGKLIHRPTVVAFHRGTEIADKSESRLLAEPMWENDKAVLQVSQPKFGIYYAISWMPPKRSAL